MILGGSWGFERQKEPSNGSDSTNGHSSKQPTIASVFDPFFGIRISSPKFSIDLFRTYCNGLKKIKLGSLTSNSETGESVIMGVIVESSGIKKSAANKDYMIWQLSDLSSDNKVKLLIFGDAAQTHWKLQPGFVIAVTNGEIGSDSASNCAKSITLKVNKSIQIMSIGLCPDYGTCMGQKKNGERCTNYVNVALSPYCIYHIQAESKKLRSTSSLSNLFNKQPKFPAFKSPKPPANNGLFTVNQTKKFQTTFNTDFSTVGRFSLPAKTSIENRLMPNLGDALEKENAISQTPSLSSIKTQPSANNLKDFLSQKMNVNKVQVPLRPGTSQFNRPMQQNAFSNLFGPRKVEPKSQFSQAEQNARKKAAEIFKRSQNVDSNLRKRKAINELNVAGKRPNLLAGKFTNDQIRKLLEKKSVHEIEVEKADQEKELKYFQKKEVEEKIETHATTLLEIKDVPVVTCKTCNYTTVHLAQRCIELNHEYVRHKARKRFFKCKNCNSRTICYSLMPTQPCIQCSCREFVRVAMRDERKIKIRDLLQLRGEERTFVNI